jgi:hypothetical protein
MNNATAITYMTENQRRAKSLAPRTPYFRTIGASDMFDVFIKMIAVINLPEQQPHAALPQRAAKSS